MKKKLLVFVLAFVMVAACVLNLAACGSGRSGSSSKDGTYYHYADGEYDEENYVIIKDNKVSAAYIEGRSLKDMNAKASVKFSGSDFEVTITMTEQGMSAKSVYSGAVKNGVAHVTSQEMYMGSTSAGSQTMDLWFCKKGKTPNDFESGNSGDNNDDNKAPDDLTPDGFVPSDYPVDNSFKGAISEESYSSKDEAARNFVSTELNGEARSATFKSYTKKEDVDKGRATEFGLTAEEARKVTSIEKGEVAYEESSTGVKNAQRASGVVAVKGPVYTIYIIVIDWSEYKYFAPELDKGDVITQSYFDSVFDKSKYTNLTIRENVNMRVEVSNGMYTTVAETTVEGILYVTPTLLYCRVTQSQTMSFPGNNTESGTEVMEVYLDATENITYVRENNGEWDRRSNNMVDIGSYIYSYILPKMDVSWFVKTDYGFSLNGEKLSMFVEKQANQIAGSVGGGAMHYSNMDASVGYKVKNGRIDETKVTMNCDVSASGAGGTVVSESTDRYTDYGTTRVPSKASLGIPE